MLFLADYTGLEGREVGGIYRRQNSGHPLFSVRDRPRRKSCCQHQALNSRKAAYITSVRKYKYLRHIRGCSSPGRAIRSQRIGSQFESDHLHQQMDRHFLPIHLLYASEMEIRTVRQAVQRRPSVQCALSSALFRLTIV